MAVAGARLARAGFWALTWGLGVSLGVALGGWLTVVGGAAAPGVESLDVSQDLIRLPLMAGAAVFAAHLFGQGVVALVRGVSSSAQPDEHDHGEEQSQDQ